MTFREYIAEDFSDIKKGAFHEWCIKKGFIKSMDEKIPKEAIEAGLKDKDEHVNKMAQFAKNMSESLKPKFKKGDTVQYINGKDADGKKDARKFKVGEIIKDNGSILYNFVIGDSTYGHRAPEKYLEKA